MFPLLFRNSDCHGSLLPHQILPLWDERSSIQEPSFKMKLTYFRREIPGQDDRPRGDLQMRKSSDRYFLHLDSRLSNFFVIPSHRCSLSIPVSHFPGSLQRPILASNHKSTHPNCHQTRQPQYKQETSRQEKEQPSQRIAELRHRITVIKRLQKCLSKTTKRSPQHSTNDQCQVRGTKRGANNSDFVGASDCCGVGIEETGCFDFGIG